LNHFYLCSLLLQFGVMLNSFKQIFRMNKILFATDFSTPSNNAFAYALGLAKDLKAKISVIHVYSSFVVPIIAKKRAAFFQQKSEDIQAKLDALLGSVSVKRIDQKYVVFGSFVADEIVDKALEGKYELIVMGMKGEHQRLEKLMGSVTTNLMMKAPCPVLAVPENALYRGIRKITLATALPSSADFPNKQMNKFAKALSAEIDFVTVDNIVRNAREYQPDQPKTVFFGTVYDIVVNPSIPDGLNDYVVKNESDVLCLYMKKRHLWERLFHFGTSQRMAYHTEIPLFVYHE